MLESGAPAPLTLQEPGQGEGPAPGCEKLEGESLEPCSGCGGGAGCSGDAGGGTEAGG